MRARGATWGVGSTIETSASILFGNFVPFVGTALVAGLPGLAFSQVVSSTAAQSAVNFIIAQIVTVTLIYGAMQALRRRQISISECLTQGFRRLGAALGVAIVAGICIGIGIVALIIPGLILATIWAVAIPAATIEQAGVGASLSRSAALTRERRWRVFGAVLVAGSSLCWSASSPVPSPASLPDPTSSCSPPWSGRSARCPRPSAPVSGRRSIISCGAREGVEIDQIATVFD